MKKIQKALAAKGIAYDGRKFSSTQHETTTTTTTTISAAKAIIIGRQQEDQIQRLNSLGFVPAR